ncbi:MAG: hypothetical protein WDW38_009167 [Sanguina aurantia]
MISGEQATTFMNPTTKCKLVGRLRDVRSDWVVIFAHGFASHKDGFHFPELAVAFGHRKVSTLRFDFAGNGESSGVFGYAGYVSEVGDIRAAVEFVRKKLGKKVLAIVGHGKGAASALMYIAHYDVEHIPAVVNICGRYDMRGGVTRRFGDDVISKLAKVGQSPMVSESTHPPTPLGEGQGACRGEGRSLQSRGVCVTASLSVAVSHSERGARRVIVSRSVTAAAAAAQQDRRRARRGARCRLAQTRDTVMAGTTPLPGAVDHSEAVSRGRGRAVRRTHSGFGSLLKLDPGPGPNSCRAPGASVRTWEWRERDAASDTCRIERAIPPPAAPTHMLRKGGGSSAAAVRASLRWGRPSLEPCACLSVSEARLSNLTRFALCGRRQPAVDERVALDMAGVCAKITLSEVLTLHGTGDEVTPVEDAQRFALAIKQHSLVLVPDADHTFDKPPTAAKAMIKAVVEFVCQEL